MRIKAFVFIALLSFSLIQMYIQPTHSDMTFIPTTLVDVREPAQLAVISWNDGVEVMFVGVNLRVVGGIRGIGLMPLPSRPIVFLGSKESYNALRNIFKTREPVAGWGVGSISVVFNVVLGPHNVTCITIEQNATYSDVKNMLLKIASDNGLESLAINESYYELLMRYVRSGYKYFLVDIIDAKGYIEGFLPPLILRFKTEKIWYPIAISSLYSGWMSIGVAVITPRKFVYTGPDFWIDFSYRKTVDRDFVKKIDPRLVSIFPIFDRWFDIYVFGTYIIWSEYLNFDFTGYITGDDINVIYYSVIFVILLIIGLGSLALIKYPRLNMNVKQKLKNALLLFGHIVAILGLLVILISGFLYMSTLSYIEISNSSSLLFVFSAISLVIIFTALIMIILSRVIIYLKTKELDALTRLYLKPILALVHTGILLSIILSLDYLALMGSLSDAYTAMLMMVLIYLGIVFFLQTLFKK